jgi:hypothetical protein
MHKDSATNNSLERPKKRKRLVDMTFRKLNTGMSLRVMSSKTVASEA